MTWHADPGVLRRYASEPDQVDGAVASSIEVHLLGCAPCRQAVADAASPTELTSSWNEIADRIDRTRPALVERVLRLLRVDGTTAHLIGATRPLQGAWLAATAVLVSAVVALARTEGGEGLFLALAPVLPLVLVAAAFAVGAEPAGEVGSATPLSGAGLVIRRAVAVLTTSVAIVGLGSLFLPRLDVGDAAWVLPALGLSLAALAASTWVPIEAAAVGLCVTWFASLGLAYRVGPDRLSVGELAPLAAPGQVAATVLIIVAGAALLARRDAFSTLARIS